MYAIYLLTAVIFSFGGSCWIDYLYRRPTTPISFPNKLQEEHIGRKFFLFLVNLSTVVYCAKMQPMFFLYIVLAIGFLGLICITDWEQYIIFDAMLIPFALSGLILSALLGLSLQDRIFSALAGGVFFFALMMLTRKGIGGGDVKLVATLGLWLGSECLLSTILMASILGGIGALCMILTSKKKRTDYFAYGPYFCIAAAWQIFTNFKG